MKISLGRVLLTLLIFLHVELFASTYEWSATANKSKAYVNEAIHLSYTCRFSDAAELYSIEFNPDGEYENYTIKLLTKSEKLINNKKVNSYEFVAFIKKSVDVNFAFDTVMKKTNEDSIKNTVLGRDNASYEEFTKIKIKQKNLHVEVVQTDIALVGSLAIELKKDTLHVKAYEPYHMEIIIKGEGNLDEIKPIEFKIDKVKVFAGKVIRDIKLTKDGYIGVWSQKFAFVGNEEFVIPALNINYVNLKLKKEDVLVVDAIKVEVEKGFKREELLDKIDEDFKINYEYFYYIFAFVLGFLISKIKLKKPKKQMLEDEEFKEKIKNIDSLGELSVVLALKDRKKYEKLILDIETKKATNINKIKKEIGLI
ncbi:BatD family protein [Candidatus Sulfurimonas marisnigri]|uniref:BatD family protein n=1 Tax=Candidatus Sulfurimonas marisnigri TaxID=2740405 RepID=A0A7S7M1J9_9BACT|nr:BatD family protein [Candidatus Sulfurimonas marisnigri]QOY55374.1 BatD family protein [Candidatus Sulfurimonas marisnigri]